MTDPLGDRLTQTITLLRDDDELTVEAVLHALDIATAPGTRGEPGDPGPVESLGRLQVLSELGRGGMGRVLEARDPQLGRSVAVKLLIDASQCTGAQLARFVSEARVSAQLEHPNIVPVHDMGVTEDGEFYFVMRKIRGWSLRETLEALRSGDRDAIAAWPRTRLLHAFIQICNAVAYAHDQGVLHRDLKPDNVMLGPFGEVLLMDWGVAGRLDGWDEAITTESVDMMSLARTMDGSAIGTVGFMSPEQASGRLRELDERSDVWSLGAILYEILTLVHAFVGSSPFAVLYQSVSGPPEDPRTRAPDRAIPEEIAAICLRAMALEPGDRFATAGALAYAVESHLEGSARREAAKGHVAAAEDALARYGALAEEADELTAREAELAATIPAWAPLEDKAELLAVRRRLRGLTQERATRFAAVLEECNKARSQDPDSADAHAVLGRAFYLRFEEAEAAGDEEDRLYFASQVLAYDAPTWEARIRGDGAVSLRTDPDGAEVICQRYDTSADLVWPLGEPVVLGRTPLEAVPLAMGSYLLTLRAPGRRDTRYPVHITRGHHWDAGSPIPLHADATIGDGFVYVPGGPYLSGADPIAQEVLPRSIEHVDGFFISVLQVTMGAYAEFLTAEAQDDPERAWLRVPRSTGGMKEGSGQYWDRPAPGEPYRVPAIDRDGDPWDPNWPVNAISWDDAQAYVAWVSARDGVRYALPSERQWEKAATGVDGRCFPWGDRFDATLCKMLHSREGRPQPEAVGAFPTDVSPYGVRDMAGSARDWCGDPTYGGDPKRRPVRGGSWLTHPRVCRTGSRFGGVPWSVNSYFGFRLVRTP